MKAEDGKIVTVKKITETYLSNSGAYYLQRYAASTSQFRTIMLRKIDKSCRAHPDQDYESCVALLDKVTLRFAELGYLNDSQYARTKVASLRQRGLSHRAIMAKLQNRGLSTDQITEALNHYHDDHGTDRHKAEMDAALKLAKKKKLGPYATGTYDLQKALGVFARAGFTFEIASKILKADDIDAL